MKVYDIKQFSAQISINDFKKLLRGVDEKDYQSTLINYAIDNNEYPDLMSSHKSKEDAWDALDDLFYCRREQGYTQSFVQIIANAIEIFEEDESGEFLYGSDYDYRKCIDKDTIKEIHKIMGIPEKYKVNFQGVEIDSGAANWMGFKFEDTDYSYFEISIDAYVPYEEGMTEEEFDQYSYPILKQEIIDKAEEYCIDESQLEFWWD